MWINTGQNFVNTKYWTSFEVDFCYDEKMLMIFYNTEEHGGAIDICHLPEEDAGYIEMVQKSTINYIYRCLAEGENCLTLIDIKKRFDAEQNKKL